MTRCPRRNAPSLGAQKNVFPLALEPILKPAGARKNDRERNAAKRLLSALRREPPHLKLIVIEDALACNGLHFRHLKLLDLRFILAAKPSDHTFLNQGYHVEHNFGHGNQHLSTVLMHLMRKGLVAQDARTDTHPS